MQASEIEIEELFGSKRLGNAVQRLEFEINRLQEDIVRLKNDSTEDIRFVYDRGHEVRKRFYELEAVIVEIDELIRKVALQRFFSEK